MKLARKQKHFSFSIIHFPLTQTTFNLQFEREKGEMPMKKLLTLILCILIALCAAGALAEGAGGLTQDVLVLFTSDVHCGVDQNFGYAGLQAVRDAAVARGDHVLLVDNGDAIQGESIGLLTFGGASIKLMNALKYDIAIPGNHDFDYGADRFLKLAELAEFPYICCNLRKDGELIFPPYLIREFDGMKIAFVGATTPTTITTSTPRFFQDDEGRFIYDFDQDLSGAKLCADIQAAVDDARGEGADYVFLMAHLGNTGTSQPYTYADVVEHVAGLDAVLDGHSHDTDKVVMKDASGREVVRQACGTKMACIGWLRISAKDGSVDTGLYTWDNDVPAPELLGIDNALSRLVDRETFAVRALLSGIVGTANVELTISDPVAKDETGRPLRLVRRTETNLGDLCADAIREASGADIAVECGGNVRVNIRKGEITVNDCLNVLPFGNHLVKLEVTGQQILDALEWGVRMTPEENGAFLQCSGMTYEIDMRIESSCTWDENGMFTGVAGDYRVRNVKVHGEPLEPDRLYTIASQDYSLLDHGDGLTAFDGAKLLWVSEDLDYTYLVSYIRDTLGGVIGEGYENPYGQERIIAIEAAP